MRYYLAIVLTLLLLMGGLLNGSSTVFGQAETPTPDETQTSTPSPTPEITSTPDGTETVTPTPSPTPNFAYAWTLSSGQSAEITFSMTAGELLIAVLLFILIGLLCFGLFLMMTARK